VLYECLNDESPYFVEGDEMLMYKKTTEHELNLNDDQHAHMSPEVKDLILSLLRKDPLKRLGTLKGGASDVKNHPWFRGFDWKALEVGWVKFSRPRRAFVRVTWAATRVR
jgi:serine/threonine protein kinase